jgi:hypothetical protein
MEMSFMENILPVYRQMLTFGHSDEQFYSSQVLGHSDEQF